MANIRSQSTAWPLILIALIASFGAAYAIGRRFGPQYDFGLLIGIWAGMLSVGLLNRGKASRNRLAFLASAALLPPFPGIVLLLVARYFALGYTLGFFIAFGTGAALLHLCHRDTVE